MPDHSNTLVAVTGASGAAGQVIVRHLREAGFPVRAISRSGRFEIAGAEPARLPPLDSPDADFRALLGGVTHVVHGAGLTNADPSTPEAAYIDANVRLTAKVARAAAQTVPGRFVLLSSIRAVVGRGFSGVIDETTPSAPTCAYGRSKRHGELEAFGAFSGESQARLVVLRPAPVYGEVMKGNLQKMLQLAHTPYVLPFASLRHQRSLLSVDALARAVLHLLSDPQQFGPAYVIADAKPVSMRDVFAAFRKGLGRPQRMAAVPPAFLRLSARLVGKSEAWQGMFADEICNPSALARTGWFPEQDSLGRLAAVARRMRGTPQR